MSHARSVSRLDDRRRQRRRPVGPPTAPSGTRSGETRHPLLSVEYAELESIRSHFGVLDFDGVPVEVMGAVQKRREDGTWEPPVDITAHREVVDFRGGRLPVLSLAYEARAYERLGRTERAALLREYA